MRLFKHFLCTLLLALISVGAWAEFTLEPTYVVVGAGATGTLSGYNVPAGKSFTLTMEVENNGSSFNQWGSSILATGTNAFPEKSTVRTGFQFYLQSSTNGQKKLDLVAAGTDHILNSVDYNESFTIVMDYADGSLHVVATDASGNSSETTVSTTLTEITSFAYGLPTGINIKTLDIKLKGNAIDADDKWHTLKTNTLTSGSSFYWYAASADATELGQTTAGPTNENLDLYLWKIIGNDTEGYTLVNKASGKYITDPTTIDANGNSIVRLTDSPSKYFYTENRSFHLASPNQAYFLASYSSSHNTVRLFNSSTYPGSIITISAPYEEHNYTVSVTGAAEGGVVYNGANYENNATLDAYIEVTTGVLTAIPVDGYQANITMEGTTITVTYTANQVVDNPQAISDMLNRIGGDGTSSKFVTRLDEGLFSDGKDKFIIGNQDGKPYIQGSSMTAIATGINWYLNHDAHFNISWNQLTADIASATLPAATPVEKTCDADYRYYLNYCTFGYSMTTWTWDRWQKEIDWMALHGINMPLQIIGLEEVWRKVLVQYNYTDDEAKAFAAGPAFTAWWGMNNLEGWGGTTDNAWFARQAKLGKDICDRMKELGMQPVLPGFAAIVPHDFTSKNPAYASESQSNWGGSFVRPWIMDPSGEKFSEVAEKYYKALAEVLGTSKYYSMDPFHEGGTIRSGKYAEGYKAVYDAMNSNCGSDTKWVIQQWQWTDNQYQKTSLTAVPAGRLIVLDLFADGKPAFNTYNGYAPHDAVFSTIPNFGGRSGFMGRLDNMSSNYFTYKTKYSTLKGIGAAPEAIESVPVVYDLLFELPWMGTAPDVTAWVADYATNRYGTDNANAQKAWESIHQSAMAFGADAIQGPIEDVWAARPNLDATPASKWGKTIANAESIYTPERRQKLISAIYDLVGESGNLSGSNYQYDIIEAGGQVMADYAYDLLLGIKDANTANNESLFNQRKDAFLSLILGMDTFKGTHQMFRLGNWTQTARDAAAEVQGATTATPDWYELDNARTIITTWGDKGPSEWGLRDYSYRSWQGLLKDYYYPRWEYYFNNNCTAPSAGWFYSEWNWAHELEGEWGASAKGTQLKSERTYYSPTPEGNTIDEANKLLAKYILPVQLNDESVKYVYRALETDLTSELTITAKQGKSLIMPIMGNTNIDGENVTAKLKIGNTQLKDLIVPVAQTTDTYDAEYIVSDGTVVKFKLTVAEKDVELTFDPDKYYTLKTGYPESYLTSGTKGIMGKSDTEPTYENLDTHLWKVVGNDEDGYTLQNKATGQYVQDPSEIKDVAQVRMTSDKNAASKYIYVNGVFQLVSNPTWYLASYSTYHNYVAIHNDNTYSGSKITKLAVEKVSAPQAESNVYSGNGSVGILKAADYITNIDSEGKPKYDNVPNGKAWQMVMDVMHKEGQSESFNENGSCILSSELDPINTYYWNNFQVYEHSATHKSPGTLNFKSNKADGYDHIIAQGHNMLKESGFEDYRVIVRYDGNQTYLIRTIILDAKGNATDEVYNNVWIAARVQNDIDVMSCALPTGTNLKSLAISIAEESNLMEDVDYAIQNIKTEDYLKNGQLEHSAMAGDAAHYQIKWTGRDDLTYTDTDGGLHHSFYIKVLTADSWQWLKFDQSSYTTTDEAQATAFIYSENSKKVQPIENKDRPGTPWAINQADTWLWDFFANFYVEVAGNNNGGLLYMKNGGQQTATNGQYLELPASVTTDNLANSSQVGYMATISKADIRLKVQYTPLLNTFYNITAKTPDAQPVLYYWYKDQQTLVTYSTTNSQSGKRTDWGEQGDCSQYTIEQAKTIPIKISKIGSAYYGSVYCPNALTLPERVGAYRLKGITTEGNYLLSSIEDNVLPAKTPAVLISEEGVENDPSGNWAIDIDGPSTITEENNFKGVLEDIDNPGKNLSANSPIYVLGNKTAGIGFYPYTGANIPAFKAYYYGPKSASGAFLFSFEDDDLTSITETGQDEEKDFIIYDLMGNKITHMERGKIYIVNGKAIKNM